MGPLDLFFHLLSFVAPAFAIAALVAFGARLLVPAGAERGRWWVHLAANFCAGALVLAAGLWHFGVDGKMATYAALVAVIGTTQWFCSRGWKP
jgi:hypothetical protein